MIAQARQNYPKLKFVLADARDVPIRRAVRRGVLQRRAALDAGSRARDRERGRARSNPAGGSFSKWAARETSPRIVAVLEQRCLRKRATRRAIPGIFPAPAEYATLLEQHGFEIEALVDHRTLEQTRTSRKRACANGWRCSRASGLKTCRKARGRASLPRSNRGCGPACGATERGGPITGG